MRQKSLCYFAAAGMFAATGLGMYFILELEVIPTLVLAINTPAFILFGYDKGAARSGSTRVPEASILMLAVLGGSFGILAAMLLFRHKTRDRTFLPGFILIVVVQLFLLKFLMPTFWQ